MFPRRGAIALALTTVALIVLINFKTPDQVVENTSGSSSGSTAIVDSTGTTGSGTSGLDRVHGLERLRRDARPDRDGPDAASTTTVTGPEVDNEFGPVQVEITVSGGKLVDVVAIQLPSGGRSGRISRAAAPILREEALQAQSANIDTVSGATYTSLAYAQSLQAALDSAGI